MLIFWTGTFRSIYSSGHAPHESMKGMMSSETIIITLTEKKNGCYKSNIMYILVMSVELAYIDV